MPEERVGMHDFKTQLTRYLRLAREGGTITITDRGQPVARLVPFGADSRQRIRELIQAGVISWNGQQLDPATPAASVLGQRTVSDLVSDNRD